MRIAVLSLCLLSGWGCSLLGPSCLERQTRGQVTAFDGEVLAGQMVSHVVPYGTEGSQNDVDIMWPGRGTPTGPRIAVYATKTDCVNFIPPGSGGPCAPIGSRGGISPSGTAGDFVQYSVIVTNGRGNPDILGVPAEYKLWVVGDPERSVKYSISITSFYGPDC